MVENGAIDTDEYDIIRLDKSFSFDDVTAIGICTHAGFRIPNQNDIVGVLKMFPNLERVDYNFIDSRLKDNVYWPAKLIDIDIGEVTEIKPKSILPKWLHRTKIKKPEVSKIELDYSEKTYVSEIPMFGEIYHDVKAGYTEVFEELKKQSPLIDLNLDEIKVTTTSVLGGTIPWVEGKQHPKISDYVLNQLVSRRDYKMRGSYKEADSIRTEVLFGGLEIVSENADDSQIIIRDNRELKNLEFSTLKAAEDAYPISPRLIDFQALMHKYFFEETIKKYAETSGKNIQFSRVNIIKYDEKLKRLDYNHVLEDHKRQQAVYIPVLQGGNGDVQKHKDYIIEKYIKAHAENGGDDIPRIIITPKKSRSIFSM